MSLLLEAALKRARTGACVLPLWWTDDAGVCQCPRGSACSSPGKHPLLEHGLHDASREALDITGWWDRWPDANIGVRTEDVSRIDIDLVDVADALARDVPLAAETEIVRTPRGGLHIALATRRLVQGVSLYLNDGRKLGDLKAAGGYVLVPPSRIGRRQYELVSPEHGRLKDEDDPRDWLATVLPAFGFEVRECHGGGEQDYLALAGTIHEGEGRHNAVVSYAGRIWVDGMAADTLVALLREVNGRQCRPPLSADEVLEIAGHFIAKRERRAPADGIDQAKPNGRPRIVVSNRHLHEIAADAWDAVMAQNDPPVCFRHAGSIAEIDHDEHGPRIVHLSLARLRGRLDRLAEWVHLTDRGPRPARPPKDVVEDMEALPQPLPPLHGIMGTPTFAADGAIITEPGYQPGTRLYYAPAGEPVPPVPKVPDETDLKRAKQIIGQEWLADFPFVDLASRAHAISVPLTAVARELIDGPTPLFAIDAPTAGTGKGLLAAGIGLMVSGCPPAVMTEERNDEELRKRVTAILSAGRPLVIFDNVRRRLASGVLAALLTATAWSDRLLGKSQTVDLPNRTLWLATGNNLQLNDEIARRTVWLRLDARVDRPWQRTSFRHPDLMAWLARHRHELVWAILVLTQNWIARGMPRWTGRPLGSFESWSRVVGGILQTAGIGGFLANREELYR
ncbi:MAG: bifunctional DNA primase/polymerase, partial [Dehalococcoidia bacterium]